MIHLIAAIAPQSLVISVPSGMPWVLPLPLLSKQKLRRMENLRPLRLLLGSNLSDHHELKF